MHTHIYTHAHSSYMTLIGVHEMHGHVCLCAYVCMCVGMCVCTCLRMYMFVWFPLFIHIS